MNEPGENQEMLDVIIIGGSFAGLSAAMALGRSLRSVLVIDSGKPCNRQTPFSHNLLTHDGEQPALIAEKAKDDALRYDTVRIVNSLAVSAHGHDGDFSVQTGDGTLYRARKLLFATGVSDHHTIPGFAECWGISVLHCPYCHGYEIRDQSTAIVARGEAGIGFAGLINQWTGDLSLLTDGESELDEAQKELLRRKNISLIEDKIAGLDHEDGQVKSVRFVNGGHLPVKAIYTRPDFSQHCDIPASFGCELTEHGYILVDNVQKTSIAGIYAAGDNCSMMRALSAAIAAGGLAGAAINKELIEEDFR